MAVQCCVRMLHLWQGELEEVNRLINSKKRACLAAPLFSLFSGGRVCVSVCIEILYVIDLLSEVSFFFIFFSEHRKNVAINLTWTDAKGLVSLVYLGRPGRGVCACVRGCLVQVE